MFIVTNNSTDWNEMRFSSLPYGWPILVFGASLKSRSGYAYAVGYEFLYIANIKAFLEVHANNVNISDNKKAYIEILNYLNKIYNGVQNI